MPKEIPNCKRFTGYKPCFPDHNCWEEGCKDNIPTGTKILIINLDAMGDVLMTTAQLPAIKRKYPESTIYWLTLKNAAPLLFNNSLIDHIYIFDASSILILQQIKFDYIMNVDKSQVSCSLLNTLEGKNKLGFGLNENGKIIPVNEGAYYNYNLGMDDNLKFKVNKRTGQDYLAETFELEYKRDEYILELTDEAKKFIEKYRKRKKLVTRDKIVGFNTGCSELYPNKKMRIDQHVYLIKKLLKKKYKIVLLGGPEDTERNQNIYSHFKGKIINTPTNEGLRKGICYESIPDVIITGDSLGMHIAIGLKKFVIAWFGVSCWTEIDLYDRGVKLFHEELFCSPCWKKSCPYNLECIKMIDLDRIISAVDKYYSK
ncbi:MAG: glycosyltransferase family 9 protein [Ignavibacteriaceae bacterium]|jgi:heptosyltransferase-2|nr:glycosyltransferase family 9 protein [Ignavibacteriaceae bacterium]MCW8814126.1 glycosyltransferase family 9 protein [Chlorobium sp.]MCW8816963.1 glycosyltransferase family 9 protein [Ignavibacteriaceae bacterium]MCW9097045.1 glycosyltransferase family 9 protein [Ignavibacteriaceae bacterium]